MMIGVIGTSTLRAPPPPETRFVAFDARSKAAAASGWSSPEGPRGARFAWCAARSCKLALNVIERSDRVIAFKAAPFAFPNAPMQFVKVSVNKTSLGWLAMPPGFSILEAAAPKAAWRRGTNIVTFEFAYAEAPKNHAEENPDPRPLAAAFLWLVISG